MALLSFLASVGPMVALVLSMWMTWRWQTKRSKEARLRYLKHERPLTNTSAPEKLREHTREFEQGIIKAGRNIHVAIGYGLANSILIEGE